MFWTILFFGVCASLTAAPRNTPYYYDNQNAVAIQETQDLVKNMRHQIGNHEQEIRMFDEKLKNLDVIIESVRDQLTDTNTSHKEQLKGNSATLSMKITSIESLVNNLISDAKQFKIHAQEASTAIALHNKKISELESIIELQSKNIEHLQAAIRSLADVLQTKDAPSPKKSPSIAQGRSYVIKAGDSLEKIAKANQVSVQTIKELNGLTNDKIVVGKTLLLEAEKK